MCLFGHVVFDVMMTKTAAQEVIIACFEVCKALGAGPSVTEDWDTWGVAWLACRCRVPSYHAARGHESFPRRQVFRLILQQQQQQSLPKVRAR